MACRRSLATSVAIVIGATLLAACSAGSPRPDEPSRTPTTPVPTPSPTSAAPEPEPQPRPELQSLADLAALEPDGTDLTRLRLVDETPDWRRWEVRYLSAGRPVSGTLTLPRAPGPHPAVVSNHGYLPPEAYAVGDGLAEEEAQLAEAGFVVLHPDYRGYGRSAPLQRFEHELRLAYTQDVVNAVDALDDLPEVDPDRIAMLGRSMGGAITLNVLVTHPGLVRAAVVYAPVSSAYLDGLEVLNGPGPDRRPALFRRFGTPQQAPAFYRALSSREAFDRVTEPVLIHHGTADDVTPLSWSRDTERLLERAGVDSELVEWPGEGHVFEASRVESVDLGIAFLRLHLDQSAD